MEGFGSIESIPFEPGFSPFYPVFSFYAFMRIHVFVPQKVFHFQPRVLPGKALTRFRETLVKGLPPPI
jgi:hypothetical protein